MASLQAPFSVQKCKAVLVAPARRTPYEFKYLSDIDDQEALRFHYPIIQYFKNDEPATRGKKRQDPVSVIREALAEALVFYYPFAGRLREAHGSSKLMVECTGEGVLFVEADANVSLQELGDKLPPPLPWLGEFLHDVPGSEGIIACPLLLVQMTRLACGGFVVAIRVNHVMSDAQGMFQFLSAVAELARCVPTPTMKPVWERHLLSGRNQPHAIDTNGCSNHASVKEVVQQTPYGEKFPLEQLVHRSFFFGPEEVSALKQHFLPDRSTTFEVVVAATWKCRTAVLCFNEEEEIRLKFVVDIRSKTIPPLPTGYYGNGIVLATALSKVGGLCQSPLSYAVKLVKKAKSQITSESIRPFAEVMPLIRASVAHLYIVSDNTRSGLDEVDYGWGKPVYGGLANGNLPGFPGVMSFNVSFVNSMGEKGVVVPISLPRDAMHRFEVELERLIKAPITKGFTY